MNKLRKYFMMTVCILSLIGWVCIIPMIFLPFVDSVFNKVMWFLICGAGAALTYINLINNWKR
jgi:hypothetical protein